MFEMKLEVRKLEMIDDLKFENLKFENEKCSKPKNVQNETWSSKIRNDQSKRRRVRKQDTQEQKSEAWIINFEDMRGLNMITVKPELTATSTLRLSATTC